MNSQLTLTVDTREQQCKRAADYLEAHPGCTLRELEAGADLGSGTKVLSEMARRFGYQISKQVGHITSRDGSHRQRRKHYTLEARPSHSQQDLFPTE